MTGRARVSSEQLRGLMTHGEHLIEHIEERSARLNRVGAAAVNVLLGICLGMLAAYALRFRWPAVDFNIVNTVANALDENAVAADGAIKLYRRTA